MYGFRKLLTTGKGEHQAQRLAINCSGLAAQGGRALAKGYLKLMLDVDVV